MKKLFFVSMMILSMANVASAGITAESSWAELKAAGLGPALPKIQIGATQVSIDGVCFEGDILRTVAPVTYCAAFLGDEAGTCSQLVTAILSTPRTITVEGCLEERGEACLKFGPVTHTLGTTYIVPVTGAGSHQRFYKQYDIKACK